MLPSAIVFVDQWPLTGNDKIDKNALPAPDGTLWQGQTIAASSETEMALVECWAQLLKLDSATLSVTANFFELGGHSLLAVQLVSLISQKRAFNLAIKDLFAYPVLADLARFIDKVEAKVEVKTEAGFGLIALADNAALPPLFIAPGLGMTAVNYRTIAKGFNPVVLTTPGIDEPVASDSPLLKLGLSERLDHWLSAIKAQQPTGHYRLLGHSFGGDVVFELAYRLQQLGDSVEVILLDSVLATPSAQQRDDHIFDRLPAHQDKAIDKAIDKALFDVYCLAAKQQMVLFKGYQPSGQLTGKVTLVLASEGLAVSAQRLEVVEHIQSWCAQPLSVVTADGDHLSVVHRCDLAGLL